MAAKREVPGLVTAGFLLLSLGVTGACAFTVFVVEGGILPMIRSRADEARDAIAERERRTELEDETERVLITLGVQLELIHMHERALPTALAGAPPEDAWGTPVRYVRRDADWGELLSAGPDEVFDTPDDIRHEVRPGR